MSRIEQWFHGTPHYGRDQSPPPKPLSHTDTDVT